MTTLTTRWTVLGAALGLAGVLALPKGTGSEADELAIIAAAPERFLVGNALTFAATALIGIGLLVLARGCAGHGHRGTAVLLRIAAAGWLLHTALIAHNAVSYELAAMDDRGAATELAAQIYAGPVFLGLLLPMLAHRARHGGRWRRALAHRARTAVGRGRPRPRSGQRLRHPGDVLRHPDVRPPPARLPRAARGWGPARRAGGRGAGPRGVSRNAQPPSGAVLRSRALTSYC